MARLFVVTGALVAAVGVVAGAFGAHSLEGTVSSGRLATFETAVLYHLIHGLGLIAVGLAARSWHHPAVSWAGWCFLAGLVLFSGSLYLLVLSDRAWFGAITPLGGTAFVAGWVLLAYGAYASGSV